MAIQFEKLPQPQACRLIEFETAEVRAGFVTGTYILIVAGTKPYVTMQVLLVPLIYTHQPEYWEIEVVACMNGTGLPAEAPYHVSIPLDGIRGTKGVEVVGATKRKKIAVG